MEGGYFEHACVVFGVWAYPLLLGCLLLFESEIAKAGLGLSMHGWKLCTSVIFASCGWVARIEARRLWCKGVLYVSYLHASADMEWTNSMVLRYPFPSSLNTCKRLVHFMIVGIWMMWASLEYCSRVATSAQHLCIIVFDIEGKYFYYLHTVELQFLFHVSYT